MLGLNLLCLLSQNRVAEFHTELERLTQKELESIYIRHPLNLEQYIMEGSYNKVISLKGSVPAESYNFFFEILLKTVRNEIASCLEKVCVFLHARQPKYIIIHLYNTDQSHVSYLRLTKTSVVLTPPRC